MQRKYVEVISKKHPHFGCAGYVEVDDAGKSEGVMLDGKFHVNVNFTNCEHMVEGAYAQPRDLKLQRVAKYQTGFFGSPNRTTKVHAIFDGHPICGAKPGIDLDFQWCADGIVLKYIECAHCERKARKELCNEIKRLDC